MSTASAPTRLVAFGRFTFDRVSRILRRDGVELALPPRVLGVLEQLLEQPGEVVTKQALISTVWRDAFVTETSIAEAISVLRQALQDDPQRPTYVQTLHRRGYRFIADVQPALAGAPAAPPDEPAPAAFETATQRPGEQDTRPPRLWLVVPWLVAGFSLAVATVAVWKYTSVAQPGAPAPVRFQLQLPANVTLAPGGAALAVSPDGTVIAIAGCQEGGCGIYVRPLAQPAAMFVAGTSGGSAPFFAPDGRTLGFFAAGTLSTIALAGGAARAVAEAPEALGATWLQDGRIVFARSASEGLFVVTPTGGPVDAFTIPAAGEGGHRWPVATADGSAVFFVVNAGSNRGERYAASSAAAGRWARLLDNATAVGPVGGAFVVGQRDGELVASRLDGRRSIVSLPVQVLAPVTAADHPTFALSPTGVLVTGGPGDRAVQVVLHWDGELERLVPAPVPPIPR
jgi:DNA-binding winged helix-turn-helix (wHTH) protein